MMKSLKTFNLDQDVIRIVRSKPNQSSFVQDAVRKLHKKEVEFDLDLVATRVIAINLKNRAELPKHLRILIEEYLHSTA